MRREPYLKDENRRPIVAGWLEDLADLRGRRPLPAFSRPALLVLDAQRLFVDPASPAFLPAWPACRSIVDSLLAVFRGKNLPVWFTRHVHDATTLPTPFRHFYDRPIRPDDPLAALPADLAGDDEIFMKDDFSAWSRPELAEKMSACDLLVLAGVQTQLCVAATAIAAAAHQVTPVVIVDGCAAPNERAHLAALQTLAAGHAFVCTGDEFLASLHEWRP
ncbi:MAG TPA: cysteine hydrolase [bacterium]|nr:cysteine hydrolase [bacterium]